MKDADLIRSIIRLRSADRPPEDVIARLGKAELASQPEATIVAIVRGYYEFKSNGYSDADIYREIEGRREQAYGQEPLPADLNLDNYTRYRLRLEYPSQVALHDPIYVMQAVHRVREALEREYGPTGMPVTLRTISWVNNALLAYAGFVGIAQGGFAGSAIFSGKAAPDEVTAIQVFLAVAVAVVVGAVGFVGKAAWGRPLLLAALGAQFLVHGALVAYLVSETDRWEAFDFFPLALDAVHLAVIAGFALHAYREGRPRPAAA